MQVSANGILEFRHQPPANYCSQILERVESTIENHTFIAVFYGDVDVKGDEGGSISYSEPVVTDENSLERAKQQIRNLTQYTSFEPTYLIVATWDKVGYHKKQNDSVIACNSYPSFQARGTLSDFCHYSYIQVELEPSCNYRLFF